MDVVESQKGKKTWRSEIMMIYNFSQNSKNFTIEKKRQYSKKTTTVICEN